MSMAAFSTGGSRGQGGGGMIHGITVASSFGASHTTFGPPSFRARGHIESNRSKTLSRRESYFKSTHHDHKIFDFEGRMIPPGPPMSQPLLSAAEQFSHYVPLRFRRPCAPYRLARVITNSFTSLLLGQGRWPKIRVHGDPTSEDFAQQLAKEARLHTTMIRARAIGGSVGTVGLSWRFFEGKPRVQCHNGKHLIVHDWADREAFIPSHVSECYTYSREEWDGEKKRNVTNWYWWRQDWTENADIVFKPVPYDQAADPSFVVDDERSVQHGDGLCHFVWIQNLPDDDETVVDGQPDYAELYEELDEIDVIKSVVTRGAKLNLDPTLILKMDPDIMSRFGIKKGSDNAITVGETGDAKYMELAGTSIASGIELFTKMRDGILESAQCVVPDPNEVAAAGTSSVALKVVHAPMLAKTDLLREQYGEGIERLLTAMLTVARARSTAPPELVPVLDDNDEPVIDGDTGEPAVDEVLEVVALEPRVIKEIILDPDSGEEVENVEVVDRDPGEGGEVELDWGDYFNPTAEDKMKAVQTLQLATAGKIISKESATEEVARMYQRDRHLEVERIKREEEGVAEDEAGMFPDTGGEVFQPGELPPGAQQPPAPEEEPKTAIPDGDKKLFITVDEARKLEDMAPWPVPEEGKMTVAAFDALQKARAVEEGKAVGAAEGQVQAAVIAPPAPAAPEGGETPPAAPPAPPAAPGG